LGEQSLEVSIIVPVRDEAESIIGLSEEIGRAMEGQDYPWECLWVDDGSRDGSLSILRELSGKDPRHRYISLEENAGQSAALTAGFSESRGAFLATLDGDGQNDPADIPRLLEILRSGDADMVNGYRRVRQDSIVRKLSSRIANGFRNLITGKTVRDVGCSTRAFRRECVENLPRFAGMHRFLPTLVAMEGYRLAEVPVNHRPRLKGRTKYGIGNRLWVGLADLFGVLWLKKRFFSFRIAGRS
jgi:dolichol-phosphate mannosyltransferase